MAPETPVRIVHIDPDGFEDVTIERSTLATELGSIDFETVDTGGESIADDVEAADIILTHYAAVPASAMDATGCSVVTCYATGVDNVDIEAATERGIPVTNVPKYCDEEVGEHIVTLALALRRGLPQFENHTADGGWDWRAADAVRTATTQTLGFFAFGRKARVAATKAGAFGFDIVAHDPYLSADEIRDFGAEPVSFEDLVENSDVLSLNAPLTPETEARFDASVFDRMPRGSILINTARGKLVDEAALVDALDNGPLAGAGLDVLATEPPEPDNPLLHHPDTIVTPHAAWYSPGAVERVRRRGSQIAAAAYEGEAVDGVVNPDAFDAA
ncbi:MAG: C-terminal binding protein [Halobellus sp.]|uniref:C-terminal binding protein n=1 Tax=Halobellus sp. TaxID=1979212 RepID=UPI0035D5168A